MAVIDIDYPRKPLLNVHEARAVLGVGKSKMYDLCASGAVETLRVGRRVLVKTESLLRFMGANEEPAA